jgi:hypothetical protein
VAVLGAPALPGRGGPVAVQGDPGRGQVAAPGRHLQAHGPQPGDLAGGHPALQRVGVALQQRLRLVQPAALQQQGGLAQVDPDGVDPAFEGDQLLAAGGRTAVRAASRSPSTMAISLRCMAQPGASDPRPVRSPVSRIRRRTWWLRSGGQTSTWCTSRLYRARWST